MASTTCPHCGLQAHLTYRWGMSSRAATGAGYALDVAYTCDSCMRVLSSQLRLESSFSHPDDHKNQVDRADRAGRLSWLPHLLYVPELTGVPEQIAGAAAEAYRSIGVENYRAAALMARAVIEASAKEHGVKTGTLYEKIQEMHANGDLTKYISDFAHTIRDFGNDAAHSDFVKPLDAETARGLLELMRAVLESLYKHRAEHEALKARMP